MPAESLLSRTLADYAADPVQGDILFQIACTQALDPLPLYRTLYKFYNLVILEAVKAWVDTLVKNPKTLHHRGNGLFIVAGDTIRRASGMP